MASRVNDTFWDVAVRNFSIRRNTHRCLASLKSMKFRMAIISNHHNPQALVDHLDRLRISSYFSPIIISASVGYRKPDPQIFNECLASLGVNERRAIYVGDSLVYDVEGAKGAGIRSILVSDDVSDSLADESTARPDFTIHDFMEIPGIVSSL
jgi:putative hydrolase of the HAD superfamily